MSDSDWVFSLFVAWLPFIVLCAVAFWHAQFIRRTLRTPDGRSLAQICDDITRELKRANDLRAAEGQHAGIAPTP